MGEEIVRSFSEQSRGEVYGEGGIAWVCQAKVEGAHTVTRNSSVLVARSSLMRSVLAVWSMSISLKLKPGCLRALSTCGRTISTAWNLVKSSLGTSVPRPCCHHHHSFVVFIVGCGDHNGSVVGWRGGYSSTHDISFVQHNADSSLIDSIADGLHEAVAEGPADCS